MSKNYTRLHQKLQRRYTSNLQRSINALHIIVNEAPRLLIELESGHHYKSTKVEEIFTAAERLRTSYIHVVENDNFINALDWLTNMNEGIDNFYDKSNDIGDDEDE